MSNTTDLVHIQQGNYSLVVPEDRMAEFEAMKGLKPSSVLLVQPTTKSVRGVLPGVFVDRSTGEQFNPLRMVLLSVNATRDKYPSATFKAGERAICSSRDGIKPITDNPQLKPQADLCKGCKHASWDGYDRIAKTGPKPTCREGRRMWYINADSGLINFTQINGGGVKIVDNLKDSIVRAMLSFNNKNRKEKKDRKFNLWDFVVDVESVQASDGAYFNFNPVKINPMTEEQAAEYDLARYAMIARRAEYEAQADQQDVADSTQEVQKETTTEGI